MKLKPVFYQAVFSMLANMTLFYILTPLIASIFNLSFLWSLTLGSVLVALFIISPRIFVLKCWGISTKQRKAIEGAIDYAWIYSMLLDMKVNVNVNIVSCMTIGPPTVGKTTLREQLVSDQVQLPLIIDNNVPTLNRPYIRPTSTPAMDRVKKVEISVNSNKQINRFTANNRTWRPLTSSEEFIAHIKSLPLYIYHVYFTIYQTIYVAIAPTWIIQFPLSTFPTILYSLFTNATVSASTSKLFVSNESIGFFQSGLMTLNTLLGSALGMYILRHIVWGKNQYKKGIKLLKQALQKENSEKVQALLHDTLIIHFRDSGGQPEFHEVVPALAPHSILYLLMFNLNEDFNTQYNVTYKPNEDDITDPYQSSFTVKQTLLQLLASIQSFNHSLQGIPSNVFIIGTHKDLLVDEESHITQIQQELEEEIKGTDWYTSDTIITTPDGYPMLPINTYSQNDIEKVKEMISQSIATRTYTVPMTVLVLYFNIERLGKSVMTINELKSLAQDCNIDDGEKFYQVLRFLRNILGSIQYFGSVPELKDIVITDPQILFDLVNELIVCTFTFKNLRTMSGRHQTERFRSSGLFKKQSLKNCEVVKKGLLTEDQVISILQHLNIIAPVGVDDKGEEEYFLPCVLVHAPVSIQPTSIDTTGYSPLLITFKCGYTPRGVFSCLISSILCSSEGLWVLASEEIYRDQIKFYLIDYGHNVLIKNCLKYLEVSVTVCHSSTIPDVPFFGIQMFLSKHLTLVLYQLKYICSLSESGHSFGFYCPLKHQSNHSLHIAKCISNAQNKHTKCTIDSSHEASCLTPQQAIWFLDHSQASSRSTFDNTNLATILQFLSDGYYYETTWYNLGLQLGIHDPTLKRIENDVMSKGGDTQTCLRECLSAWLRQEDSVKEKGSPRWFTLASALDAIGQCRIATIAYEKDLTLK